METHILVLKRKNIAFSVSDAENPVIEDAEAKNTEETVAEATNDQDVIGEEPKANTETE